LLLALNQQGRLRHAANASAIVELAYDAIGQLLSEKSRMASGDGTPESVLRHTYDALGNRTQTVLPDGRILNHLYYGSGHLHQINIDGEVISDIERDSGHRETSRTQGALTSQFRYDPVGRLTAQIAKLDPARASLAQQRGAWTGAGDGVLTATGPGGAAIARQYQYDLAGNLVSQSDQRFGKTIYQYDAIGRILAANQPNLAETFAFDPAHNLLDPAAVSSGNGGRVENNQVTVFEDKRFAYDAHGNLVEKKVAKHTQITLAWNAEHQLIISQATRNARADAPTVQQTEYGYDPFGRRVFKRDAFGTTRFVSDGNRLLAEVLGSHTRTYLYGANSFVPVAQVDSGIQSQQSDPAKNSAQVLYFHTDHLGTPRELTDSGGNLHWAATYKAWGNVLRVEMPQVGTEAQAVDQVQALRFQGQYFDVEPYCPSSVSSFISFKKRR
jgi:YD repeat-containing protein